MLYVHVIIFALMMRFVLHSLLGLISFVLQCCTCANGAAGIIHPSTDAPKTAVGVTHVVICQVHTRRDNVDFRCLCRC